MRWRWLGLAGSLLCGCAPPGPLFLTIEADRGGADPAVPQVVDAVSVAVFAQPGDRELYARAFELNPAEHRFPLTLALESTHQTPPAVRVRVGLLKQDLELGFSEASAALYSQQVNQVTVRVVLPAP